MKKYITLILGCLLMAACKQEVLESGQMIQGRFALDGGTGLTDEFLHFDKGHLSIYWVTTSYPFAEGKIWCCQNKDVFYLAFSSGYSITDGWLNSPRLTGPIELKDGKLSIGDRIYYALESFEGEPYPSVSVINKIICPYVERDISIPYTIDHPLPSGSLQCSTETDWITDLAVQNGEITAHLSATSSNRDGAISVSYPYVDPIIITVEQRPFTFIRLEEETRTVEYTAQNVVLPYTIDNPVSGSSLTAVSSASWINNIRVSENQISFNVAENNVGSSRSATITLRYEGASDVVFTVTQQWSAPVITLTPSSQTLDYTGGTFGFNYSITNPREGVSIDGSSQADWITIVSVSSNMVVYKVEANSGYISRDGKINLNYGGYISASYNVTQGGYPLPEGAVDLGLSVLWASCNLGASSPEDYGDYYAWGETEAKSNYSWSTYKFGTSSTGPFSKYNFQSSYGLVDNKTVLDPEDDVARVKLGGQWRMPTDEEWTELWTKCTWTWTTNYNGTGVKGRIVTASNGTSIFLPAAGYRDGTSLYGADSYGFYWSSSLYTVYPDYAWYIYFDSGNVRRLNYYRFNGQSVRPVTE